jgi:formamidopyrimidine-DNA glycosylase
MAAGRRDGGVLMIELPEAVTIAAQMTEELRGKRIESAIRGNALHKFAFYSASPDDYARILTGRTMGNARAHGSLILANVEPDYVLALGFGGERIQFHRDKTSLPKKHQLMLRFADDTHLTVTVQGWGFAKLWREEDLPKDPHMGIGRIAAGSPQFTRKYFQGLLAELPPADTRSAKYFIITKPGVWGVGNGYLQDILFRARIHPRKSVAALAPAERNALYGAICATVKDAIALRGRDTERDLYDQPGRYVRILDSRNVGQPCPNCKCSIQKESYLGGAIYFCPMCQK